VGKSRPSPVELVERFGADLWVQYHEYRRLLAEHMKLEHVEWNANEHRAGIIENAIDAHITASRGMYSQRFLELFDFHTRGG
jgi:YD repeat-containing protein